MTAARLPQREDSRAVLIGAGTYAFPDRLPPIPAAARNLADLHRLLTGPGGVLDPTACEVVSDPASRGVVGEIIEQAAEQAIDTLIVYYTGHGLLDRNRRLHLALTDTRPDRVDWTALPFTTLRDALLDSPAATKVLILDCCFSGRAFDALAGGHDSVLGQTDVAGTYTITSSAGDELSFAPVGQRNTAFTAALITVATETPGLTLDDLYTRIRQNLLRHGYPRPERRAIDTAGGLVLFPRPVPEPPSLTIGELGQLIAAAVGTLRAQPWVPARLTGTTEAVLTGHTGWVWSVAFSPDGALLASTDGTVRLWDPRTRELVGEPLIYTSGVWSVAFSPDGALLATAGRDGTVRLWDPRTREPVGEPLTGRTSTVWSVAFSPDGALLATAGFDGTVRLWK